MKRMPAGEALGTSMLTNGLGNLDSRGLAALLKELAKERHTKRAREVSGRHAGRWGSPDSSSCPVNCSSQLLSLLLLSVANSLGMPGERRLDGPSACNHSRVTTTAAVALASAAVA